MIRRILKHTGADKIMSGFVAFMLLTALVIWVCEPEINTYREALWYCFTVVSTIGFGDVVVHTAVSRSLSVVLSLYAVVTLAIFTGVLAAAQADAFLFDCFSNPSPGEIRERLLPFIETVRQALPGIPLVFQRTIRREGRNFNLKADSLEAAKIAVADSMMALACRRYSDVYYITPSATPPDHLSSVDGVHPDDYGYTLWARSLRGQLLPILKKYGIE